MVRRTKETILSFEFETECFSADACGPNFERRPRLLTQSRRLIEEEFAGLIPA